MRETGESDADVVLAVVAEPLRQQGRDEERARAENECGMIVWNGRGSGYECRRAAGHRGAHSGRTP